MSTTSLPILRAPFIKEISENLYVPNGMVLVLNDIFDEDSALIKAPNVLTSKKDKQDYQQMKFEESAKVAFKNHESLMLSTVQAAGSSLFYTKQTDLILEIFAGDRVYVHPGVLRNAGYTINYRGIELTFMDFSQIIAVNRFEKSEEKTLTEYKKAALPTLFPKENVIEIYEPSILKDLN